MISEIVHMLTVFTSKKYVEKLAEAPAKSICLQKKNIHVYY